MFIGLRGTDEAEGFKGAVRGEEGIDPLIRGTGVEFMPEGISDIGDNEDIDSIVKKYIIFPSVILSKMSYACCCTPIELVVVIIRILSILLT